MKGVMPLLCICSFFAACVGTVTVLRAILLLQAGLGKNSVARHCLSSFQFEIALHVIFPPSETKTSNSGAGHVNIIY